MPPPVPPPPALVSGPASWVSPPPVPPTSDEVVPPWPAIPWPPVPAGPGAEPHAASRNTAEGSTTSAQRRGDIGAGYRLRGDAARVDVGRRWLAVVDAAGPSVSRSRTDDVWRGRRARRRRRARGHRQ